MTPLRRAFGTPVSASLAGLLTGLLLWVAGGCSGEAPAPLAGHNLVLINIDTLRADHLGCYGYGRDTSPFIDSLAEGGVLFERALSASSYTRESVAALFTGRLPSRSGGFGWNAIPPRHTPTLGELLRGVGYRTAFLSNTVMLARPGFTRGFETVQHLQRDWDVSGEGPRLSASALRYAKRHRGERFALYLHYLDPHAPYDPEERFTRRFREQRFPEPLTLYDEVSSRIAALEQQGFGPGDPRFEDLVLRYDAEIAATDEAIQVLFEGLRDLGLLGRTLVVLTADHGEEFLEHGYVDHGWTLYQESIHVPLLFWAPEVLAPARPDSRVSQVDVLPSILELLGIPYDPQGLDGASLFEIGRGSPRPRSLERPQIAELLIPRRNVLRTILQGPWKYVAAHRWLEPSQRPEMTAEPEPVDLWGEPVFEELFQLEEDPGERQNRLATAPEMRRELSEALARFRAAQRGRAPPPSPPSVPAEERERLRALGYHE